MKSSQAGGGDHTSAPPSSAVARRLRGAGRLLGQLYRKPTSAVGASLVLLFLTLALLGPFVAPYSATQISPFRSEPPSWEHPFGTDHFGRDVFSRVILGAGSILALAGVGTLLAVLLGTLFGLVSGYRGGWLDEVVMRAFDSLLAVPALLLALLLLGTIGPAKNNVMIVLVVVYTPIVARVVRSEVLGVKTKGFVESARLQGESSAHILSREILPSVLPALSVEGAMRFTYAIFLVASLGFLGVGVQPPTPNWGLMVKEARDFAGLAPWSLLFPALAISVLVVAMNLLADGLKRVLQAPTQTGTVPRALRRARARAPRSPAGNGAEPVVALRGVTVSYFQGGRRLDAVRDVDLTVARGQTYGLVGESGSGKSTLAMALMRYLSPNGAVTRGEVAFEGDDLLARDRAGMRAVWGRRMNLVPQDPLSSLNPSIRVGEQIAEILRQQLALSRPEAERRVTALLESVQIADPERVARSYPHQLSGGMQQRVMIAMALSTDPRFLALDEPTTGLDVTTEATVLDLVRDLIRRRDTAALYISHDLGVVAGIADRVAVLYAGELVEDAATEDLYRQPLHPYTQGLLDSVPRLGQSKRAVQLTSMRGQIPSLADLPSGCVFAPRCPLAVDRCWEERPQLETPDVDGAPRRVRCHRWEEVYRGTASAERRPVSAAEGVEERRDGLPALALRGLKKHFRFRGALLDRLKGRPTPAVRALDGVDLTIRRGETLGLVGESGSGKSTLARCVVGLEEASSGEMELLEVALPRSLSERGRQTLQQLQMVFQNPQEALNPYMTVGQTLRRTLRKLGRLSAADAQAEARRLLRLVRLGEEYVDRLPAQLSGGEKQRVAIARAFAARPELVLCDEPTSALDVSVQARILNLLNDLQRAGNSAYLFISHDLSVVGYLADVVGVIYLGRLMEVGRTEALLAPPYHPYTEALLSSIPLLDPSQREARVRVQGDIPSATDVPSGCPFHTRCPRYLGAVCKAETPPWRETGDGHRIYCHIPLDELRRIQQPIFQAEGEG